jgi:prophage antirepressor-like protein
MSNNLITIQGVRGFIDENGTAQLNLEDVARGLGFTTVATSGNECIRWSRLEKYLTDFGFNENNGYLPDSTFIPENIFYLLAMKASNKVAIEFQKKVANEILPSIRKNGGYLAGLSKELQAIFLQDKKLQIVESRVEKLENTMTIDYSQQEELRLFINKTVIKVLGGTSSAAYQLIGKKAFAELYRFIKNAFQVNSYKNISTIGFEDAKSLISTWDPSDGLRFMIIGANTIDKSA